MPNAPPSMSVVPMKNLTGDPGGSRSPRPDSADITLFTCKEEGENNNSFKTPPHPVFIEAFGNSRDGMDRTGARAFNEGENGELACLKDLSVSHLDIIQQLSETLSSKDKVINDLTLENSRLRQRIERMERRVTLKSPGSESSRLSSRSGKAGYRSMTVVPGNKSYLQQIIRKRSRPISSEEPQKSLSYSKKHVNSTEEDNKEKDKKLPEKPFEVERPKTEAQTIQPRADSPFREVMSRFEKLLITAQIYYTVVGDSDILLDLEPSPQSFLEVPYWQIRHFTSSGSVEGTEELSNDVFDRRHFRLAIEEKKRKRWDIQRIRQQQYIERLRQKEAKGKTKPENKVVVLPVKSFWPDADEVLESLSVAVTDYVPVGCFGINIPKMPTYEFSLPWLNQKECVPAKTKRRSKR